MNRPGESFLIRVLTGGAALEGHLVLPTAASGLVVFAHGSGSSRHSPRNQAVATALSQGNLATLLIDLLTPEEEQEDRLTGHLRFDIGLLADRVVGVTDWLQKSKGTAGLSIGYFGASTGGGAALVAAAERPDLVRAVVSRGGRPDLAGAALSRVRAPTLLIVGGRDEVVLELNREAYEQLRCEKRLAVVPGATHLFEEPGALEEVAHLSRDWFRRHLATRPPGPRSREGAGPAILISGPRNRSGFPVPARPPSRRPR